MDGDQGTRHLLAKLDALELELERAHHLLDLWGVEREVAQEGDRPLELSLEGRLRLLEQDADSEAEEERDE